VGWQPVAVVQYIFTHKQYTEQRNEGENIAFRFISCKGYLDESM
jgi:hypothetical protein